MIEALMLTALTVLAFALGYAFRHAIGVARIEVDAMPDTITEIDAALRRFEARYPPDLLLALSYDLKDVATDAKRARLQVSQALAKPGDAREHGQAVAAYGRLEQAVARWNLELSQLRGRG